MPTKLSTSKLFIPPLRPSLVPRPRLIQLLNEGLATNRKLTLVSAPAGFGKTTLVVDWLKQAGLPVAWLSVDEADNDLPRFLAYLAAAFQQVDEEIGSPLQSALQSPHLPALEKALTSLLNEIALKTEPLILVLDDYHLLTEAAVVEAMGFLLGHQPQQMHLVLTTREDPDLPLARLRARDQLTEIRARDLRFNREEVDLFLRGGMGLALSEQDVAALEGRTEGWVAGLQLAGLSMQKQANLKSFIADFSGSHRHILDYLTDEVIEQQPESIRTFLLRTSILERFCAELCDEVMADRSGPSNASMSDAEKNIPSSLITHHPSLITSSTQLILDYLDHANLFIVPLDNERRWYRYHHLFSDLLRSQLARSQPGWIPELHRRAGRWFAEHGDIRAAVEHALLDTDLGQAAQLIEQHAFPKLYQGHVALVLDWFDRLPEGILQAAPMLCIAKAWALALMQRGPRTGEVERAFQAAIQALDQVKAEQDLRDLVAGHAATIQAYLLRSAARSGENPEMLIALSRKALHLLPEQEKAIRSVNFLNIGYANLVQVDLRAAELAYQHTLEDGLAGENYYAAIYGPINLAMIALLAGRLKEALQLCETYIERFNTVLAGQNFPPIGALAILKGSILLEYNRLAEAEPVLLEGLDLIRWTGEYEAPMMGYTALARLRAIQGNRTAMLEAIKTLAETCPDCVFHAQALLQSLSMRYWPVDLEIQEDAQAWLAQSGIAFEKLAVVHSVDPLSIAYFESYLGAALVLARLATGEAGAYPLEAAHAYLNRQSEFAETHGIASWVVTAAIARSLLYQATGKKDQALETLQVALCAAAPTGLFRIFVDECELLQPLLVELRPRLKDEVLIAYANRLLQAMHCGPAKLETGGRPAALLSERELEVLRCLANGLTYEAIGQQLFLSLNTVQFHVKNIYGKLLVNKRVQAIERARELHLI